MALDSPLTTYSDTTPQKRVITDVISLIDPSDTVAIDALGGLDGAAGKFRFVNGKSTVVEWLEDTLAPLTDTLNGSITVATTTLTVTDASVYQPGFIILIDAEYMWVSAVDVAGELITVTRNFGGTTASHASNATVSIVSEARLEGDDSDPLAFTDRTTGSNYTQIFHQEVKVTRTQTQIDQYGIANEFDYQTGKAVAHLGRLLNLNLYHGQRKAGSATTPRAAGGFATFITNNTVAAGGALVQDDFDDAAEAAFNDGGTGPWKAFLSSSNMQVAKGLLDSSSYLRYGRDETGIGMRIEKIVTPFGDVDLILDRWSPTSKVYLVDQNNAGMMTFHPFMFEPLAKDGDYEKAEVVGEFTLCVRQDKSHAVITGVT